MARRARAAVARLLRRWADLLDPRPVGTSDGLVLLVARLRWRAGLLRLVGDRLPVELQEAAAAEAGHRDLDLALVALHAAGVAADAAEALADRVDAQPR